MKKVIYAVLMLCIILCISGCSTNVNTLIEVGKYEEALAIIEESPDEYPNIYDEVRYRVAEIALKNNEFEKAVSLLDGNLYNDASALLDETKYNLASAA
ncbi:MAG: tetratricopeptide repeat protein [Ruminococcaceae bacterium]|nr:tetratricopeptide repeat protein [Oscillospiraceae bacterium]